MGQPPALILAPGNSAKRGETVPTSGITKEEVRKLGSEGEDWSELSSEDETSVESSSEDEAWTRRDSDREGGGYRGSKDLAAELLKAIKNLKPTRGDLDKEMDENKEKRLKRLVKGQFEKLLHTRRQYIEPSSGSDLSDSEIDAAMEKQLARLIVMLGAQP